MLQDLILILSSRKIKVMYHIKVEIKSNRFYCHLYLYSCYGGNYYKYINQCWPVTSIPYNCFLELAIAIYHMEGKVGGWKHWWIWRITINSPKFLQPNYLIIAKCSHLPKFIIKCVFVVNSPKFAPTKFLSIW